MDENLTDQDKKVQGIAELLLHEVEARTIPFPFSSLETLIIQKALQRTNASRTETAKLLGMNRITLTMRMRKAGLLVPKPTKKKKLKLRT
jgi:DNA-binding NtrC family response regulator